jgi:hypothetical protein
MNYVLVKFGVLPMLKFLRQTFKGIKIRKVVFKLRPFKINKLGVLSQLRPSVCLGFILARHSFIN